MVLSDLEVAHRHVTVNGLRFHYVERGSGPLVVLLHGFPENWWSWRYQIAPLADAGFRVIVPDQRGYNETDKTGPFDLDTLASDVVALVRELGATKAHIVGHDWGGAVAWHLAAKHPAYVDKLAVLNCPHPARMLEAFRTRRSQLKRSWYMFLFQIPLLPEFLLRRDRASLIVRVLQATAKDRSHFTPDELKPILEGAQAPGAMRAMVGWYRSAFRDALRRRFRPPEYPTIEKETVLIWAMDDPTLGYDDLVPGTERYAPRLRVEAVEDCGHFVQAEQPKLVNVLLRRFLRPLLAEQIASSEPQAATVAPPGAPARPAPSAFDVILTSAGDNKIGVIKEMREITGLDLEKLKWMIDFAPKPLKQGVSWREAQQIESRLAAAGARVDVQ
jgi:epoxide hydrolase 4